MIGYADGTNDLPKAKVFYVGAVGVRGEQGPEASYGACFRDVDGNKPCAFKIDPA